METSIGKQSSCHSGWLYKRGTVNKWKKRYFVQKDTELYCYKSPHSDNELYCIEQYEGNKNIENIIINTGEENTFVLNTTARQYLQKAETSEERDNWTSCIKSALLTMSNIKEKNKAEISLSARQLFQEKSQNTSNIYIDVDDKEEILLFPHNILECQDDSNNNIQREKENKNTEEIWKYTRTDYKSLSSCKCNIRKELQQLKNNYHKISIHEWPYQRYIQNYSMYTKLLYKPQDLWFSCENYGLYRICNPYHGKSIRSSTQTYDKRYSNYDIYCDEEYRQYLSGVDDTIITKNYNQNKNNNSNTYCLFDIDTYLDAEDIVDCVIEDSLCKGKQYNVGSGYTINYENCKYRSWDETPVVCFDGWMEDITTLYICSTTISKNIHQNRQIKSDTVSEEYSWLRSWSHDKILHTLCNDICNTKYIVGTSYKDTVLWDINYENSLQSWGIRGDTVITNMMVSSSSVSSSVSASYIRCTKSGIIERLDFRDSTPIHIAHSSTEITVLINCIHNSKWYITGHIDGSIRIWEENNKLPQNILYTEKRITCIVWSLHYIELLIVGHDDGTISVIHLYKDIIKNISISNPYSIQSIHTVENHVLQFTLTSSVGTIYTVQLPRHLVDTEVNNKKYAQQEKLIQQRDREGISVVLYTYDNLTTTTTNDSDDNSDKIKELKDIQELLDDESINKNAIININTEKKNFNDIIKQLSKYWPTSNKFFIMKTKEPNLLQRQKWKYLQILINESISNKKNFSIIYKLLNTLIESCIYINTNTNTIKYKNILINTYKNKEHCNCKLCNIKDTDEQNIEELSYDIEILLNIYSSSNTVIKKVLNDDDIVEGSCICVFDRIWSIILKIIQNKKSYLSEYIIAQRVGLYLEKHSERILPKLNIKQDIPILCLEYIKRSIYQHDINNIFNKNFLNISIEYILLYNHILAFTLVLKLYTSFNKYFLSSIYSLLYQLVSPILINEKISYEDDNDNDEETINKKFFIKCQELNTDTTTTNNTTVQSMLKVLYNIHIQVAISDPRVDLAWEKYHKYISIQTEGSAPNVDKLSKTPNDILKTLSPIEYNDELKFRLVSPYDIIQYRWRLDCVQCEEFIPRYNLYRKYDSNTNSIIRSLNKDILFSQYPAFNTTCAKEVIKRVISSDTKRQTNITNLSLIRLPFLTNIFFLQALISEGIGQYDVAIIEICTIFQSIYTKESLIYISLQQFLDQTLLPLFSKFCDMNTNLSASTKEHLYKPNYRSLFVRLKAVRLYTL